MPTTIGAAETHMRVLLPLRCSATVIGSTVALFSRRSPIGQDEHAALQVVGGGGFSVLPSGFPFPVPGRVVLTCTANGIVVDAGSCNAVYKWSDLIEVKAVAINRATFVTASLADGDSLQLSVNRGSERFASSAQGRLDAWESALPTDAASERAQLKSRIVSLREAKNRRREAARNLPMFSKERASGFVVARQSRERVGGGSVALNEDVMIFHDPSNTRMLAAVPYRSLGELLERTSAGGIELVARADLDDVIEVVLTPLTAGWVELYRTYVEFDRAHDLRGFLQAESTGNAATSPVNAEELCERGIASLERGDLEEADGWLAQSAALGYAPAMCNLGVVRKRQGDIEGPDGALHWYRLAANAGHDLAEFNLGLHQARVGDLQGPEGASYWYARAAASGNAPAMHNLACIFVESGDDSSAAAWFRKAADRGYTDSMFNLGSIRGKQGDVNGPEGAIYWYRMAADAGHSQAEQRLWQLEHR